MKLDFLIPVMQHPADVEFYDALGAALEAEGRTVGFVPLSREGEHRLSARPGRLVRYLYQDLDRRRPVSDGEVAELEARYRLVSMREHVYAERLYYGASEASLIVRAVHAFRFMEKLLDEHQVGLFVNNVGAELIRRTTARIADAGGPGNVVIEFAPFHGRHVMTTSELGWDALPDVPPPLTPGLRATIEQIVADATGKPRMFGAPLKLGIDAGSLVRPLRNIARYLMKRGDQDWSPLHVYADRARHVARRALSRFVYQPAPEPGEKYVFFPLQMPIDSTLTVRAPQFEHQEAVVEYLARHALPSSHSLLVKSHPGAVDYFSLEMFRALQRLPGVRIVDPMVSAHRLAAGADAVVCINSTVGFESLLHSKPVVVLGRVYYRGHGATRDVDNLYDLPKVLRRAIGEPVDREAIWRFLGAAYSVTRPGVCFDPAPDNVKLLAKSLIEKAGELGR